MLTVVQRVSDASVTIHQDIVAQIEQGLLILCGFEKHDTDETLKRMVKKCLNYRIFSDTQGKMNLSLKDVGGGLLLVPQFTLLAETERGLRPSFTKGAPPDLGRALFKALIEHAREQYPHVTCGSFGADMQVRLCNDGPVTFILHF
ncbi:D-aminoacyl-tRNA deacylase [Legionella oakridgensis]|uniref:D-aminoacyl-tRNA deacylase n=2 Tax=Legionella oakridgensis TaxID=29423 RepID=W0BGQ8_9GAMM|nr:D-aminoacyl-tRNA deacylase [Legionella oakridgensis]AHE67782.1 D-tyrosyl-tRNATyr deacylase [Legionella oakridgensis ATCC 33761 = DSM 21215]ETO92682.1 D-tyrosyl-tRNA(Tyr) deacylase [Legionella oakridgensis RV-2-2007]KTD36894.1 D-tyr-tRNA(Tyr) deacylase [Legionella oakridgensis]STY20797.1 D-tyr-tRNA(Tyr) deacylase [Legionella longbeachae]